MGDDSSRSERQVRKEKRKKKGRKPWPTSPLKTGMPRGEQQHAI